jgi:predicted nucleotide-binding protein
VPPRRNAQPPAELPLYLAMPREEAAGKIAERMERGNELKTRAISSFQAHEEVQRASWTWSEYNDEMLRRMFTSPKVAEEYSSSFGVFAVGGQRVLQHEIKELHDSIDDKIRRLVSIKERLELIPLAPGIGQSQPPVRSTAKATSNGVFVVHGHDDAVREAVARFITKLDLIPVILHEQASQGRTVVEKLEHHGDAAYAIVLLTPDDVGGTTPQELQPRARQNVVLELGYFLGRLGRDRVCALHRGELELPSDYMGVIYIPFDGGGGWRLQLAKELRAAGFAIDMNKAL